MNNSFNKSIIILFIILFTFMLLYSGTPIYKQRDNSGGLWNNWSGDSLCYMFQATGLDSLSAKSFGELKGYDGLQTFYLKIDTLGGSHDAVAVNNGVKTTTLNTAAFDSGGIVVKLKRNLGAALGWQEHQLRWYQYTARSTYLDTIKFANIGVLYVSTFRPDSLNSWFSDVPTEWSTEIHNAINDDSTQTWKIYLEYDMHKPNK